MFRACPTSSPDRWRVFLDADGVSRVVSDSVRVLTGVACQAPHRPESGVACLLGRPSAVLYQTSDLPVRDVGSPVNTPISAAWHVVGPSAKVG